MKNMHREHLCSRVHVFYFRLIGRQPVSEMERSEIELKHGSYLFIGRQPYIEPRRDGMARGATKECSYPKYSFANASNTGIERSTFSVGIQ